MISRPLLVGISTCLFISSCSGAKDYSNYPAGTKEAFSSIKQVSYTEKTNTVPHNDQIQAQDLIDIQVYKVPDLSKVMRVNDDGSIALPLIGTVKVLGLTTRQLEKLLEQRFSQRYLQNPQVTVVIKEATKRRVTIEGHASKPGVYPVKGGGTLLQAIATAGGLSEFANINKIFLFRKSPSGEVNRYHVNLKAIRDGAAKDPVLHNDDRIVIHRADAYYQTKRGLGLFGGFLTPFVTPLVPTKTKQ
jgi:polysaccharide export outer membrane protein